MKHNYIIETRKLFNKKRKIKLSKKNIDTSKKYRALFQPLSLVKFDKNYISHFRFQEEKRSKRGLCKIF